MTVRPKSNVDPIPKRPRLSRQLGLTDLLMMGVGMMIGAGAILGMGESVHIAGAGGTLLAFLLSGGVALATAMAYGEMSSAAPKAGSTYQYARIAFGTRTGFMAGWISWFAAVLAGCLYAGLCGVYLVQYVPFLADIPLPAVFKERACAVVIVLLLAIGSYRGVEDIGKIQTLLTVLQMVALAFIALAGIAALMREPVRLANFRPLLPRGWLAIPACIGFEFVAFEGFEVIASAGEEARRPRHDLPRAMILSVVVVTATYLVVAFGLIAAVPRTGGPAWEWLAAQGERGFAETLQALLPYGAVFALATVLVAATSALNATIYAAARTLFALGRDGLLPASTAAISQKTRVPHVSLTITLAAMALLAAALPVLHAASAASILFLFVFALANACVLRLRRNHRSSREYRYRMPFFPALPLLTVAIQAGLAIFVFRVSPLAWAIVAAWCLAGVFRLLALSVRPPKPSH